MSDVIGKQGDCPTIHAFFVEHQVVALSGTLQTANIGIEKMICTIVANPNIRYLILGGPESMGHTL